MNARRRSVYLMLGVGIMIGVVLGLVVSGPLGLPLGLHHESSHADESQVPTALRRAPDPNVVTIDPGQTPRFRIAPVRLREFRDERTAVGRIAFNDEHTSSVFAPFQGRVLRLIAKPGDVVHPGSPLLIIDSPDLVQANADLIAAGQAAKKAE